MTNIPDNVLQVAADYANKIRNTAPCGTDVTDIRSALRVENPGAGWLGIAAAYVRGWESAPTDAARHLRAVLEHYAPKGVTIHKCARDAWAFLDGTVTGDNDALKTANDEIKRLQGVVVDINNIVHRVEAERDAARAEVKRLTAQSNAAQHVDTQTRAALKTANENIETMRVVLDLVRTETTTLRKQCAEALAAQNRAETCVATMADTLKKVRKLLDPGDTLSTFEAAHAVVDNLNETRRQLADAVTVRDTLQTECNHLRSELEGSKRACTERYDLWWEATSHLGAVLAYVPEYNNDNPKMRAAYDFLNKRSPRCGENPRVEEHDNLRDENKRLRGYLKIIYETLGFTQVDVGNPLSLVTVKDFITAVMKNTRGDVATLMAERDTARAERNTLRAMLTNIRTLTEGFNGSP